MIPNSLVQAGDIKGFREAVLGGDGQKQVVFDENNYRIILEYAYQ